MNTDFSNFSLYQQKREFDYKGTHSQEWKVHHTLGFPKIASFSSKYNFQGFLLWHTGRWDKNRNTAGQGCIRTYSLELTADKIAQWLQQQEDRQTKPFQDFSLQAKSQQEQPPECKQASDNVTKGPIVAYRDYKWPFILYTDGRKEGLGLLLACIQDGREYTAAYSKRIFQPSKQNYPTSSSFSISRTLITSIFSMMFCSIPWNWSLLRERSFTWSISSSCFQRNIPSSHTLFNSWKTFTDNRGSVDHGQQADLDRFLLGLQTEISRLDRSWQRVFPEGIGLLMPADI